MRVLEKHGILIISTEENEMVFLHRKDVCRSMTKRMEGILREYAEKIQKLYPKVLRAVILYGSYARGDYTADSDVDVMVLVDLSEQQICGQREKLSDLTYDFNETYDLQIKPMLIGEKQFEYWLPVYPFYQNIKKDGVKIYAA